jgi:hypothetical protein|tara:strand:+ start:96 stop:263 length:168 start_codon:yes stop_codon:yes gene_type:complete
MRRHPHKILQPTTSSGLRAIDDDARSFFLKLYLRHSKKYWTGTFEKYWTGTLTEK